MTPDRARTVAVTGIVGPAVFALAAIVGATQVTGYSHVHNFVSELAAVGSDARVLMTIGFITFGVCILAFSWSLRVLLPGATVLVVVVALSGVGTLTAGTFSCDPGCPAKGEMTTHQQVHNASSVLTFSAWIVAPFVAARQLRGRRFARASVAIGVVALVVGIALGSMADHTPDDPVGLAQRVVLVVVGLWFVLLAFEVRRPAEA